MNFDRYSCSTSYYEGKQRFSKVKRLMEKNNIRIVEFSSVEKHPHSKSLKGWYHYELKLACGDKEAVLFYSTKYSFVDYSSDIEELYQVGRDALDVEQHPGFEKWFAFFKCGIDIEEEKVVYQIIVNNAKALQQLLGEAIYREFLKIADEIADQDAKAALFFINRTTTRKKRVKTS